MIDGDKHTFWSSRWNPEPDSVALKLPFEINIDLNKNHHIGGLSILNRPVALNNTPHEIEVQTSKDGKTWEVAAQGALFARTSVLQYAYFDKPVYARHVKLIIHSISYSGGDYSCSFAELGFFTPDK